MEKKIGQIKEELKGQGFTCKQMKGMVREGNYFDGIVLYLSKWNWDNHESWHLYNWDDKDDKEVMLGIYEAEQYHPQAPYRYRDNFEKFQKDWISGESRVLLFETIHQRKGFAPSNSRLAEIVSTPFRNASSSPLILLSSFSGINSS